MTGPLRIGVNALYLIPGGVGGTEIYLRSLLDALARVDAKNEYFIFINAETASEGFLLLPPRFHTVACGVKARFRPERILWEQMLLPWWLRKYRIDVVFNPGFTAPLFSGRPTVTVFHDLQHKRHPEFFRWFDLPFWNLLLGLSIARSRSLVAVSDATAQDLARYYPRAASKTIVIRHGVDVEFFRIGERRRVTGAVQERYMLVVSTLHPHKNLTRLLEAFAAFRTCHPEFRLVIAGLKGFAADILDTRRRELGLGDSVRFTGWIPRVELYRLFEGASAFLAPSEFEGFGMPVIEALAAGIPTACSAIPPFDEIAGSAAVRFDQNSVAAIAAAMERITGDAAFQSLSPSAGPAQARHFDWDDTATRTLRVLEAAAR